MTNRKVEQTITKAQTNVAPVLSACVCVCVSVFDNNNNDSYNKRQKICLWGIPSRGLLIAIAVIQVRAYNKKMLYPILPEGYNYFSGII